MSLHSDTLLSGIEINGRPVGHGENNFSWAIKYYFEVVQLVNEIYSSLQVSAANRVYRNGIKFRFSFIKMSDRKLNFFYLFCQIGTFLFLLNRTSPSSSYTYCKHPFSRNEHLQYMEIYYWAQK